MSRIGKKPINIPSGVDVSVEETTIKIKGPKGVVTCPNFENLMVNKEGATLIINTTGDVKSPNHGLAYSLIVNAIKGVTSGHSQQLKLVGVGYKAAVNGNKIVLNLGFSHPVDFDIPSGIEIKVEKLTTVDILGCNKQEVGQVAAEIRAKRPPEPYKGKGVRYTDEYIRRKQGKSGNK